ncbi:cation efflux protein, CzcI-like [Acinetobacter sp. NIPH 2699]|uniref:cation efflux protein, CzcI-like n=1 Tax=Acinetobacter sp. NIPH 2699 TaxID=2923433 RepID=UPI001F4A7FE6|nr:cation efflux protein, CzcI-like [Acinetobacter sp. NIPH 2699]MCH7335801.1 cation transporter [Acinetobacter sp. NIPH 2699]
MRRSSIFITVLLSLFMFQSLWNVAAAYCGHENINQPSTFSGHFGHHIPDAAEATTTHIQTSKQNATDLPMPLSLQDHHDHLPSCFHVVTPEAQQQFDVPILRTQKLQQKYYWSNSYQSPHLSRPNPPPVLTPLLVG